MRAREVGQILVAPAVRRIVVGRDLLSEQRDTLETLEPLQNFPSGALTPNNPRGYPEVLFLLRVVFLASTLRSSGFRVVFFFPWLFRRSSRGSSGVLLYLCPSERRPGKIGMPNGARNGAALRIPRISSVAGRPAPLLEVVEHVRNRVELTEVQERTLKESRPFAHSSVRNR